MSRASRSAVWGITPLALVVVTLLGSVLIPARQTWRITRLLGESTRVLALARLLQAELQSGLAREVAALQSYVLFGDEGMLERYRSAAAADDRRLAALERLDRPTAARVAVLRGRVDEWRRTDGARMERGGTSHAPGSSATSPRSRTRRSSSSTRRTRGSAFSSA